MLQYLYFIVKIKLSKCLIKQSPVFTTLRKKAYENIFGKGENARLLSKY